MPNILSRLLPEPIRTIDTTSFDGETATFFPFLNVSAIASPLTNPSRVLIFVNESGNSVFISWDGLIDHVRLLAGASFIFDEESNAVPFSEFATAQGTQFYARGTSGVGNVWLSTFYAA